LALNAADYTFSSEGGYSGVALYPKYNITENVGVGLRGEYFKEKDVEGIENPSYTSATLTARFTHGGLSVIPELRLDNNSQSAFLKKDGVTPSKQASQVSIALVYAF